jgi:hypothetical protein
MKSPPRPHPARGFNPRLRNSCRKRPRKRDGVYWLRLSVVMLPSLPVQGVIRHPNQGFRIVNAPAQYMYSLIHSISAVRLRCNLNYNGTETPMRLSIESEQ